MTSNVQLEHYPRVSLDDDLTAVDEERVTFITGSTKPSTDDSGITGEGPEVGARTQLGGDKDGGRWQRLDVDNLRNNSGLARWKLRLRELYQNNQGLLFIMLSQLCGSCMNVSVKLLNGLDPPVPPFEVSMHFIGYRYI